MRTGAPAFLTAPASVQRRRKPPRTDANRTVGSAPRRGPSGRAALELFVQAGHRRHRVRTSGLSPSAVEVAGLYVHVPFCTRRCVYCDFYVTTTHRDTAAFARAAALEIEAYGREFGERETLETIYIGGGTPSLLSPGDLAFLLDAVFTHFEVDDDAEITLEANPEDVTAEQMRAFRRLGVNRVSLGVQSFFDEDLVFMTRNHSGADAERSVEIIADTFETYSLDLIFGVPEQPFEHWGANLERAVRLGVPHLSAYSLTIEAKTPLERMVRLGTVIPADDDVMRERFLFTHAYLGERGLAHYEVSSFSRPGHESRHNSLYWSHANVLAVGPGAHAFWRETRSIAWRWANVAHLGRWRGLLDEGHLPVDWRERIGPDALADEAILLGLRRLDTGLDLDALATDYGVDLLTEQADTLAALESADLLSVRNGQVKLTAEGAAIADAVALRLVG
ncbi:MAG: radical SAM family heme chaperone HemW [Bacteroidota bacterium]